MKHLMTAIFLALFFIAVQAQQSSSNQSNKLSDLYYFLGNWSGEGAFGNGKPIAADLSFKMDLDSAWIVYTHTDKAPNRFKALSMWGADTKTGERLAYTFDSFNGHRKFETNGWEGSQLKLSRSSAHPQKGTIYEHFIYEKISDTTFKMAYEVSNDNTTWKLVDALIFKKQ
jgi:hypothetical protein